MKKKNYLIVSLMLIAFSFNLASVNAKTKCGLDEDIALNKEVINIKANFEEKERIIDPSEYDLPEDYEGDPKDYQLKENYFQVNIMNLSDKFYLEIKNEDNSFYKKVTYNDVHDSVASFNWTDLSKVTSLTLNVYTSDKTSCPNEEIRRFYLTLPRYNSYHEYAQCNYVPDSYICQKYVTFDELDFNDYIKKVNQEIKKKDKAIEKKEDSEKSGWQKFVSSLKKNKKIIFICLACVVTIGIVVLIIYLQRRKKDIFKK